MLGFIYNRHKYVLVLLIVIFKKSTIISQKGILRTILKKKLMTLFSELESFICIIFVLLSSLKTTNLLRLSMKQVVEVALL